MRTLALPHGPSDWIQWIARGLSLLWAGFWTYYCVGSAILVRPPPAEFITDIVTALVFCAVTFCAWRYELAGGQSLVSVSVIDFLFFRVYSRPFSVWLALVAPPLLAGVLFFVHSRRNAR